MNQTFELGQALVEQELSHHGVKGMKWGFRKTDEVPTPRAPDAISIVPHAPSAKTKIETHGGENHPAHEDAINVALAKQKMKKSGVHALSNKELQDVATRMNLEQQVHSLESKKPKSLGQEFVSKQIEEVQKQAIAHPIETAKKVQKGVNVIRRVHKLATA